MGTERILLVDDEPAVLDLLKEYLEGRGYAVFTASNAAEALSAFTRHRPHVVLLDILMPEIDGLTVLRQLRELDRKAGVIMLTAVGDEEVAKEALRQGAYDYITKPVDLGYLELSILARLAHEPYSLQESDRT